MYTYQYWGAIPEFVSRKEKSQCALLLYTISNIVFVHLVREQKDMSQLGSSIALEEGVVFLGSGKVKLDTNTVHIDTIDSDDLCVEVVSTHVQALLRSQLQYDVSESRTSSI